MNKPVIALALLLASFAPCQANFFISHMTKLGTIIRQGSFLWNGRCIKWVNETQAPLITRKKIIDLSHFKGPFWIHHAIGNIEIRESFSPRLEIHQRLQPDSLDDVDVDVIQVLKDKCTNIKTTFRRDPLFKSNSIMGEGVHCTLFLPPFDPDKSLDHQKIAFLSVLCGSIKIRHSGVFEHIGTRQGSIDISGARLEPSDHNFKTIRGSICAQNIIGSMTACATNGKIEVCNIDGNVDAESSNGSIRITDVNGNVKARTANGKIVAQNIKGKASVETAQGKISLDNVKEFSAYSVNGKMYHDGNRIDV